MSSPTLGALRTPHTTRAGPFTILQYMYLDTVIILHMYGAKIEVARLVIFNMFNRPNVNDLA